MNLNIHAILIAQVNAIQELKTEIDAKNASIQSLQNDFNALKVEVAAMKNNQ